MSCVHSVAKAIAQAKELLNDKLLTPAALLVFPIHREDSGVVPTEGLKPMSSGLLPDLT